MKPAATNDRTRQEWMAVAIVTVIGACLRLWPIGRLGLTHFDEGIYAFVASWVLQPQGIAALDPLLIPYAPPGYPILGGLAYSVLGRSDTAMIFVSQMSGTITIPVVAWLGRRTFGPGTGFAAAVFCAFSGPHIAFSRMALTDVSFLLAWLVALGAGMRFLERPGFLRALLMGLAVGLAQQFKYNGWLTGGIIMATAGLGILVRPEDRQASSILKTFGWGAVAVGVAWVVVWPWYRFVEAHGGYSALLRHQQTYLGGFRDWWPNFLIQADQAVALSGGPWLIIPSLILVSMTPWIARPTVWIEATHDLSWLKRVLIAFGFSSVAWFLVDSPYQLGLIASPWLLTSRSSSVLLLGVWWLSLEAISPFYHPYARLWLPLHAANWIFLGGMVAVGFASLRACKGFEVDRVFSRLKIRLIVVGYLFFVVVGAFVNATVKHSRNAVPQADLLAPSDSLRRATRQISAVLPDEVKALQLLVRPPVTDYLAGRVVLFPMSGSDQLKKPSPPNIWALVDSAILRSELGKPTGGSDRNLLDRFANHWEVVEEFPTTLSLPTLLDLDPGAARSNSTDRSCSLWLLRPRRSGANR